MMLRTTTLLTLTLFVVACGLFGSACGGETVLESTTTTYDPAAGAAEIFSAGKADGLIDLAQELTLEQVVSGKTGGEQLDIYRLDLRAGDTFKALLKVESGDLNPHILLFRGTNIHIHSQNWDLTGQLLVKDYKVEFGGRHLVVVKAFHGQGEGRYTLSTTCTAGPCNGDIIEDPIDDEGLDINQKSDCISMARKCSLERVSRYNGKVGDVRAQDLWDECLGEAVLDNGATECATACIGEDEESLCNDIRDSLKFYADVTDECRTLVTDCMESCYDAGGDGWADEFWSTAESVCWQNGFNGTCDGYARGHETCGGTDYKEDDHAQCYAFCETTSGAWMDDLDVICDEECDFMCEDVWDACSSECGPDSDDCAQNCVDFRAPTCL